MSGLPPYQNQAQVSPAPYQNSLVDKSASPIPSPVPSPFQSPDFAAQGPPPQVYGAPYQGPPGQSGLAPPNQYGPPSGKYQPGPYGPPPGQAGGPPPPGQYGMPFMMPTLTSPDQLKGKDYPCLVNCPNCQFIGMTNVKKNTNVFVMVLYFIFLIVGIAIPPLLIPAIILAFFTRYQVHECVKCSHQISSENKSCG